jgi:hypothetical protein
MGCQNRHILEVVFSVKSCIINELGAVSSAAEHRSYTPGVAGSNPAPPTNRINTASPSLLPQSPKESFLKDVAHSYHSIELGGFIGIYQIMEQHTEVHLARKSPVPTPD